MSTSPKRRRKAKVYKLPGATLGIGEPEKEVVDLLSSLLTQAKVGEIIGLGVFYVNGGNTVTSHWVSGCASHQSMVFGVARLQYRILRAVDEG